MAPESKNQRRENYNDYFSYNFIIVYFGGSIDNFGLFFHARRDRNQERSSEK